MRPAGTRAGLATDPDREDRAPAVRVPVVPPTTSLRGARVSWSHVLPLAVVLAYANGFWIITLRGAVGAIQRTSAPFDSWLRESALLVPVYVVAVLAAFMVAQRWFGPRPRGVRRLAVSGATVAGATALTGTALLALSSWFDFRLQRADLQHMSIAHPGCDASCLSARIQATADLLIKSIWVGLILMVVTDLVLVALVVAFRGGRLVLARPPSPHRPPRPTGTALVLAAGLAGAGAIHLAVIDEHLAEWWAAAVFFVVLALAELTAAAVALSRERAWRLAGLWSAIVVSAGPLLVWTVSRTWGLPFGPEAGEPEAIGAADVLSCVLEVLTLALAVVLLRRELRRGAPSTTWSRHGLALALTGVLAVTLIGVGGSSLPVVGAFSHLGGAHVQHETASEG